MSGATGKYRIVPAGVSGWGVQGRWLFWWRDIGRFTGYDYWQPYWFLSELEARTWVSETIAREQRERHARTVSRQRKQAVPPIEL